MNSGKTKDGTVAEVAELPRDQFPSILNANERRRDADERVREEEELRGLQENQQMEGRQPADQDTSWCYYRNWGQAGLSQVRRRSMNAMDRKTLGDASIVTLEDAGLRIRRDSRETTRYINDRGPSVSHDRGGVHPIVYRSRDSPTDQSTPASGILRASSSYKIPALGCSIGRTLELISGGGTLGRSINNKPTPMWEQHTDHPRGCYSREPYQSTFKGSSSSPVRRGVTNLVHNLSKSQTFHGQHVETANQEETAG
ncbi:hypothetical protein GWI33_018052 [Rhynchophorus ferrugineus]|uniref:Uncharacterized protein n=1 Tax=Rhynchophorus ferrugineus TaxID=354439 RepID=A0A834I0Y5_RHYFE|nr:hypothetical protein GWI33_018052 [Rhynchophorus ferrugineus]